MAGETIGRVEFHVDLDGTTVVQQAREIGREIAAAGTVTGDDFAANFDKSLSRRIGAAGERAAANFQKGFRKGIAGFTGLEDVGNLRQVFPELTRGADQLALAGSRNVEVWGGLLEDIGELKQVFDSFGGGGGSGGGATGAFDDASDAGRRFRVTLHDLFGDMRSFLPTLESLNKHLQLQGIQWKDLSQNTRQWTLIIAAVAAAMEDLAVLGSAAGAGILALGAALQSTVIGGLALIPVFTRLNQEVSKAPLQMQGAINSFTHFKTAIHDINDAIAMAAFDQMGDAFGQLSRNARALQPTLQKLGTMIGELFDDLARNTEVGSDAFGVIQKSIELATLNFAQLARIAGTLGVVLVRSFNEAQPLVVQLLGWVNTLVSRFDVFTRSASFDDWINRAVVVFGHFGQLLDATGRALNNLVTPGSTAATIRFLDNLTGFMPNLEKLLNVLGQLDVFGLAAQALNDFGVALEPLAAPVGELADAVNRFASIAFNEIATAVGALGQALLPVINLATNFLNALDENTIRAIADAAVGLAIAFVVLSNAVKGLVVIKAISKLYTNAIVDFQRFGVAGEVAGTALKGLASAAGWAAFAGAVFVGLNALKEFTRQMVDIEGTAHELVATNATLTQSYNKLNDVSGGAGKALTNVSGALDHLAKLSSGNPFATFAESFSDVGQQAVGLKATLGELDGSLASLAESNLPAAVEQFSSYAKELGATDEQVLAMIASTPEFEKVLQDAAVASGELGSKQDVLSIALGRTKPAADDASGSIEDIATTATDTIRSVDDLADAIRHFGDKTLDTRTAAREYEAALDDLAGSISENGTNWDITTEAGRKNQAALDDIAQSAFDLSAATKEQTGSQEAANGVLSAAREELIKNHDQYGLTAEEAAAYADSVGLTSTAQAEAARTAMINKAALVNTLEQFGLTGDEADLYAGKLDALPEDVDTVAELVNAYPSIKTAEDLKSAIDKIPAYKTVTITVKTKATSLSGNPIYQIPGGGTFEAAGDILTHATHVIAGEAGPEAIVPLRRPLSMVNPDVRWLSAIAQGKHMAAGGIAGGPPSKSVNIQPGAITIQGSLAPEATATNVVNRIAQRIGG